MKNNRFSKFSRNIAPERSIVCSCGANAKLKIRKNYPFGKKSKVRISKYYRCEKCGKIKFLDKVMQKGGVR